MNSCTSNLILRYCGDYGLDHEVIAALVYQESKGKQYATRFEPKFFTKKLSWRSRSQLSGFVPPSHKQTLITEKTHRATSWGLFQIMGETARWFVPYEATYLSSLVDLNTNISIGVRYFDDCLRRAKSTEGALQLYNGSPAYPPLVLEHVRNGNWKKIVQTK